MQEKILSLDLGVTSIGFAVLERKDDFHYSLLDTNVWMRNNPFGDGDSPKKLRRSYKSQRNLIKKRRKRAKDVRRCLIGNGVITSDIKQDKKTYIDSWRLRGRAAYERKLSRLEFLNLMQFFAKHRGYKSLSVEDMIAEIEAKDQMKAECEGGDEPQPPSLEKWQDRLAYMDALKCQNKDKTVGQIIFDMETGNETPTYRNHDDYRYMIKREDVAKEIEQVFAKQEEFGFFPKNTSVNTLKEQIKDIILTQEELQPIEDMINRCALDKTQKCGSLYSYSYDYFKLLRTLNEMNIGKDTKLTIEQRDKLLRHVMERIDRFESVEKLTVKEVRKLLGLEKEIKINKMLDSDPKKKKDKTNVLVKFKFFAALSALDQETLQKIFAHDKAVRILDELSYAVLIHTSPKALMANAREILNSYDMGLSEDKVQTLILSLYKNKPAGNNSGKYSFKTLYRLIPELEKEVIGENIAKQKAGFDEHKEDYSGYDKGIEYLDLKQFEKDEDLISNHSVKSLVSGALRLVKHLSKEHGEFDKIKIESARELSIPDEVQKDIENAQKKKQEEKERIKKAYAQYKENLTDRDVKKIRLWEQQGEMSLYDSGVKIGVAQLLSEKVQIEHIVPRALGGVDADYNKIVDFSNLNSKKGNRLPMDFLSEDKKESYAEVVKALKNEKKINFKKFVNLMAENLDKTFHEVRDSNLMHATSYAEILLGDVLKRYYPFANEAYRSNGVGVEHIQGRATSHLRQLLHVDAKSRYTNFHHAEDAILVGVLSKSYLQKLSKLYRENYGTQYLDGKEVTKQISPFIEGAKLADVIYDLRKRYEQDLETSPFYKDFHGDLRAVKFFVSKKPIDTKAHNETVQGKDYSYRVSWEKLLGNIKSKPKPTTDPTKFAKEFDKEIIGRVKVLQENPKDPVAKAIVQRKQQIVSALNSAAFINTEDEKEQLKKEIDRLWSIPLKDSQDNDIRRIKRVGEEVSINIRGGKAATAKSLHYVKFIYGARKFTISRVDIRNSAKEAKKLQPADTMKVYENDLLEIFKESKKVLHSAEIGIVKGFTESGVRVKLRNPKFPTNEDYQPKEYTKWKGIGSLKGIKKYDIDITGKVQGFYRLGRVLVGDEVKESKVVIYEKLKE